MRVHKQEKETTEELNMEAILAERKKRGKCLQVQQALLCFTARIIISLPFDDVFARASGPSAWSTE
jgi:hypothetical protein